MKTLNEKLALLQSKIETNSPVTIMIIGLGSVVSFGLFSRFE